jgi:hypothetical protein
MVPLRAKALRSSCLNWLSQPLFSGVNDAPMIPGSEHRLDVFWRQAGGRSVDHRRMAAR